MLEAGDLVKRIVADVIGEAFLTTIHTKPMLTIKLNGEVIGGGH